VHQPAAGPALLGPPLPPALRRRAPCHLAGTPAGGHAPPLHAGTGRRTESLPEHDRAGLRAVAGRRLRRGPGRLRHLRKPGDPRAASPGFLRRKPASPTGRNARGPRSTGQASDVWSAVSGPLPGRAALLPRRRGRCLSLRHLDTPGGATIAGPAEPPPVLE